MENLLKPKYIVKELNEKQLNSYNKLKEYIEPNLAKCYALRHIENISEIQLSSALISYKLLKNIDLVTDRIITAILKKEKICIIADYDADGATSCSIGLKGLKILGADVNYLVPNRFIHGYGLTPSIIEELLNRFDFIPNILLTVDNGISSIEGVNKAYEYNMEVIVTDHHIAGETIPNTPYIINPNQKNCDFPSKNMAGCGVIFYVIYATFEKMLNKNLISIDKKNEILNLLDLVAIGTISDVVYLDENNRKLVKHGLNIIKSNKSRVGINSLIKVINKKNTNISTSDIGFSIGPRINAAGRLEDMSIGIQCLTSDNPEISYNLAQQLNQINQKRKSIETNMKDIVLDLPTIHMTNFVKVAYSPEFHEGVIGIVASRLKELYNQPTIVFSNSHEDNIIKGSGRSIPEIHLRDILVNIHNLNPNIFTKFGGHAMAAGMSIYKEKLHLFMQLFETEVKKQLNSQNVEKIKYIDTYINSQSINIDFIKMIKNEIWGQGFEEPLFYSNFNIEKQYILKNNHLKLILEKNDLTFEAIWFFKDHLIEEESFLNQKSINKNFIFSLQINDFFEIPIPQLLILDIL